MRSWRTRFAPSPTGHLHLGHAYSALCVWHYAGGDPQNFLLRIDDLDYTRSRPEYVQQIYSDLHWLGIRWQQAPQFQSQRLPRYQAAFVALKQQELIYPCYLSRVETSEIQSAPHDAPERAASTKGALSQKEQQRRHQAGVQPAWRLDMQRACEMAGPLFINTLHHGTQPAHPEAFGDVIIARRDIQASYHLSVILDDSDAEIELVVRGKDLEPSTHIHRLLQTLLDIEPPLYHHHQLITDDAGKRLAKRDDSRALSSYREKGWSAERIREYLPDIG